MNKLRARAHRRGDTCDQTRSARTDGDDTGHEVSGGYGVAMAEGGSAVRIPTTNDLYGEGAYESGTAWRRTRRQMGGLTPG
jgi:hypothetical protein